ncbi:zf-UBP-domain-containing protein [Metschnikowia bicuspidata var. bicuspidata NRRL YB-4993]|uniref:Zf-UBP-domain-containing protein n=1 Tax=Metschnikowia bicuspidata var. bicuspidata NRRL YB-4993 TaxID=869754 RepID=A0A1A0H6N7_9ASCO|nr:zf-UBP-domain-containing protein [Metschnikowia bicuspidata var. bicuspidata NRRL YB-4993]OBA19754.1 zf-UBP-domain-containing protein [Metschnikowia bicuspidata var. bicuspidata NRRL YB-4993]
MIGTDSYHISIESLPLEIDLIPIGSEESNSAPQDYRISEISVFGYDSIEMSSDHISHEPLKAQLLGRGAIRLFRDFDDGSIRTPEQTAAVDQHDDTMLSIIALPTYFTATDLLGFIGDHYMDHVTHIRVLKSEKPNRFLVLVKFNDALKAAEFQYHFDGKPFNSMEPEACHVVFVRSVTIDAPVETEMPNREALIPFLMKDPFTSGHSLGASTADSSSSKTSENLVLVELPTCPVCLEKLDCEISGLLTIPCQHTFHCQCLSKWRDDTCPVCRYTNSISNQRIRRSVRRLLQINSRMQQQQLLQPLEGEQPRSAVEDDTETCMNCTTTDNLWVCLICGNLGCSRYAPEQHLLKHFVESGHCFAMELDTSRVWDYAGDSYVHRLIASESDGKIVEFPNKAHVDDKVSAKLESESDEYSELLLSQLISQREYYELLLKDRQQMGGARRRSSVIEPIGNLLKITELEEKLEDLTAKLEKVTTNVIPALKQKIDMKQISLKIAAQELQESNALCEGLSQKVEFLTEENEKLKVQNEDLGEQVKDLMFYLESQEKFKDQPPEVTEGQVIMRPKKKNNKKKK